MSVSDDQFLSFLRGPWTAVIFLLFIILAVPSMFLDSVGIYKVGNNVSQME